MAKDQVLSFIIEIGIVPVVRTSSVEGMMDRRWIGGVMQFDAHCDAKL